MRVYVLTAVVVVEFAVDWVNFDVAELILTKLLEGSQWEQVENQTTLKDFLSVAE